ncbi:MAG: hypothetical protein ABIO70_09090 [Pseudomonadota bacterium]
MPITPFVALCATAFAGQPAYYHPDHVGPHSALFQRSSAVMAEKFDTVQGAMARVSPSLVALDLEAALVSRRAPEEYRRYAEELRRESNGQMHRVQAFVDTMVEDFEVTFKAAMGRALPQVSEGYQLVECAATGIHAMLGRTQCAGEDLNPALAKAMDRDPALAAALAEIEGLTWPAFTVTGRPQPVLPLTGVGSYLRVDALADALVASQIAAARARLDEALEPVQAAMEEGETPAERKAALDRALQLRDLYDRELGLVGDELITAVEGSLVRLENKGVPPALGLCANPVGFGGCTGNDVTEQVLPLLLADKKLIKALVR